MGFMMIPAESYRILTWIISMNASRTASNPAWRTLPVDQFISRTDITRLVEACEEPRDQALIMLMRNPGHEYQRASTST